MPYLGSPSLQTSVAMQEIIDESPESWTFGYYVKELQLMNDQACTIIVNNDKEIYLRAKQGWGMSKGDTPITSLIIKEPNITFNWCGSY